MAWFEAYIKQDWVANRALHSGQMPRKQMPDMTWSVQPPVGTNDGLGKMSIMPVTPNIIHFLQIIQIHEVTWSVNVGNKR